MKRLVLASALVLALQLLTPAASARPPAGSGETCPSDYQPMTWEQIQAQAQRLGVAESDARAMFTSVNKNEDAWICQKKLPGDDRSYNFLDNQAVGHDKRP